MWFHFHFPPVPQGYGYIIKTRGFSPLKTIPFVTQVDYQSIQFLSVTGLRKDHYSFQLFLNQLCQPMTQSCHQCSTRNQCIILELQSSKIHWMLLKAREFITWCDEWRTVFPCTNVHKPSFSFSLTLFRFLSKAVERRRGGVISLLSLLCFKKASCSHCTRTRLPSKATPSLITPKRRPAASVCLDITNFLYSLPSKNYQGGRTTIWQRVQNAA